MEHEKDSVAGIPLPPSRRSLVTTKADVWERNKMEKIRKRYQKIKSSTLDWENNKKMHAKLHIEKKKKEKVIVQFQDGIRAAKNKSKLKKRKETDPSTCQPTRITNPLLPFYQQMAKHGVTELAWQNGRLNVHGINGLHPIVSNKPTWNRANDTLESVVNQAKLQALGPNLIQQGEPPVHTGRAIGKWVERGNQEPPARKRTRSTSEYPGKNVSTGNNNAMQVDCGDHSVCGSASAAFCKDNDTTLMTWPSFDSPPTMKAKSIDEDSACHVESENQEDEQDTKHGASCSHFARRSRTAAIHNQSERRRRDRINEKMKALQKLVPNASKTDKASMLDEVIEYLKQLQAEVQYMSVRSRQQMIMAVGMQQHLQMSLLARMGMGVDLGMGMGMLDMSAMARPAPQSLPPLIHPTSVPAMPPAFVLPHFLLPSAIPKQDPTQAKPASNDSVDPFCAFVSQTMNMDIYNKMSTFYRQQVDQTTKATNSPTQPDNVQGN